jgi:hypothetical protein
MEGIITMHRHHVDLSSLSVLMPENIDGLELQKIADSCLREAIDSGEIEVCNTDFDKKEKGDTEEYDRLKAGADLWTKLRLISELADVCIRSGESVSEPEISIEDKTYRGNPDVTMAEDFFYIVAAVTQDKSFDPEDGGPLLPFLKAEHPAIFAQLAIRLKIKD